MPNQKELSQGVKFIESWNPKCNKLGYDDALGAVITRYLKVFKFVDPAWFKIHRACQSSAYTIGVVGFITGIVAGNFSPGIIYTVHLIVGIILASLASLQVVFAVAFRPGKDHKYIIWWNVCHYIVGYSTIGLSIYNVFKGFTILNSSNTWQNAYIGYISGLASVAVIMKILTWAMILKRKHAEATKESTQNTYSGDNLA